MNPQTLNAIKLRASLSAAALLVLLLTPLSLFAYAMPTPHQAASLVDYSLRGTNDVASAALPKRENTASTVQATGIYTTFLPLVMAPEHFTSDQLIDRALASGAINAETALIYKVYAAFSDSRLPAQYKGDDSQVWETHIVSEVRTQFTHLSPAAQAIMEPFLLPPSAPGSWLELPTISASLSTQGTRQQPVSAAAAIEWGIVSNAGSPVKVWYEKRYPGDDAKARAVADAMDTKIWPDLTRLMGSDDHKPISDAGYSPNGGDGRFDIYLVHVEESEAVPYLDACDQPVTPAYVLLDSRKADLLPIAAHEFMHAIIMTYKTAEGCHEYDWLDEATATWAEDYVYPINNSEHPLARNYLANPEDPLFSLAHDTHGYRAYLFLFFLTHSLQQPGLIKAIWDNTVSSDSLESINYAIPGGFQEQWPRFTLANWNRDSAEEDSYQTDGLTDGAKAKTINLALNGASSHTERLLDDIVPEVKQLAATYYHLVFTDDNIRSVGFKNPFANPPYPPNPTTASVQALIRYEGKSTWENPQDWTNFREKYFCRDMRSERVAELVLIFGNSEFRDRDVSGALPPVDSRIEVSNVGCWKWNGTASSTSRELNEVADITENITVSDLVFQRKHPEDGQDGPTFGSDNLYVVGGNVTWTHSGTTYFPGVSGPCSGSSSRNYTYGPGDFWDGVLTLALVNFTDSSFPVGSYSGGVSHPIPNDLVIAYICEPDHTVVYRGELNNYYLNFDDGQPLFQVSADGLTIDGQWTKPFGGGFTAHYTWHLEAQREP